MALSDIVRCWISSSVWHRMVLDPQQWVLLVPRGGAHDGDPREGSARLHSSGSQTTKGACHEYSFICSLHDDVTIAPKGTFAFGTECLHPDVARGGEEAEQHRAPLTELRSCCILNLSAGITAQQTASETAVRCWTICRQ